MATDFSYASKLGLAESAVTAARTEANPTEEGIARRLGIAYSEALPILDEIANVPATMAAPTVTPLGGGSVSVAFVAPAANGTPITGYLIASSVGGKTYLSTDDLVTPIVATGFTPGAQTFTIRAINDIGQGAASPASGSVTVT